MQMALMNRHLEPTSRRVFMMPSERYTYVSSRLIKEVAALGGVGAAGSCPPVVERLADATRSSTRQREH